MKWATFNVNRIKTRLPNLLHWLEKQSPDMVCLQELKALDTAFPEAELNRAGYGACWKGQHSWNGVAILVKDGVPVEIRRELPGDSTDGQSRYLEAAVNGTVDACLYLPNSNPQPGPKFDCKLAWFERLHQHALSLYRSGQPVVLAGDFNVIATDADVYNPKSWLRDADATRKPRRLFPAAVARLAGLPSTWASRQNSLHLLGLFSPALATKQGAAHRPHFAERRTSPTA